MLFYVSASPDAHELLNTHGPLRRLEASAEHVSIVTCCGGGRLPPEALDPAASDAAASAAAAAVAPAQAAWERLFGELAAAVERQPGALREVHPFFGSCCCTVRRVHWDE